jgi:biotin transport system substrate-specific component
MMIHRMAGMMEKARGTSRARELAISAVFAAMTAAGGLISIPFFPVPLTLQTFFVYLSVLTLRRSAVLGQVIYLALGLVGLPVFAEGMSGYATLLGPTGGFLFGFVFGTLCSGMLLAFTKGQFYAGVLSLLLCAGIVFGLGWIWLAYWLRWNFVMALWLGVLPFLPGDAIKLILALVVGKRARLT